LGTGGAKVPVRHFSTNGNTSAQATVSKTVPAFDVIVRVGWAAKDGQCRWQPDARVNPILLHVFQVLHDERVVGRRNLLF